MFESFYQLTVNPFRLAPDPKFCFSHPSYDEAHAYLEYAFKMGEGFVIFTGRPGTGKTTLIHTFLNRLDVTQVVAAKVAVTNMNAADLLRAVAYAFDIDIADQDMATVLRRVEQYFVQQIRAGKRSLLIIDEAQGLSRSALEELRMLADLQTESRFLLQIFLVGHEKLREFMVSPEMEQFQQRVTGTCKLVPLNQKESRDYIEYRLCQVEWNGDPELTGAAVSAIYKYSGGIPRHINKLCTRLMLHGLLEEKHVLDKSDVLAVAEDLKDELLAPLFTQQPEIETNTADLAIQASSVPRKPKLQSKIVKHNNVSVSAERKVEKPRSRELRTYLYGEGKDKVSLFANRIRRNMVPATAFSVLAAVMLFLVVLVFNGEEGDKDNGLLASRNDAYETWVQVSRYRDGVYEEYPAYEEPAFVQENRARRSAMAVHQRNDTGQPTDTSAPEPEVIAGLSVAGNMTSEMAAFESEPDVIPPTIVQQPDVVESTPSIESVALQTEVSEPDQVKSEAAVVEAEPAVIPLAIVQQPDVVESTPSIESVALQTEVSEPDQVKSKTAVVEAEPDVVEPQPAISEPDDPAKIAGIQKYEVARLLLLAYESLSDSRLLIPSGNNAYEYYMQVDTLDPGNKEAAKGIGLIVDRYFTMAEEAISSDNEETANLYINRGLRIRPADTKLLALQTALIMKIEEPVEAPTQQVRVQEPSGTYNELFARLKNMMDKDQIGMPNDSIWHDEDEEW